MAAQALAKPVFSNLPNTTAVFGGPHVMPATLRQYMSGQKVGVHGCGQDLV